MYVVDENIIGQKHRKYSRRKLIKRDMGRRMRRLTLTGADGVGEEGNVRIDDMDQN